MKNFWINGLKKATSNYNNTLKTIPRIENLSNKSGCFFIANPLVYHKLGWFFLNSGVTYKSYTISTTYLRIMRSLFFNLEQNKITRNVIMNFWRVLFFQFKGGLYVFFNSYQDKITANKIIILYISESLFLNLRVVL